MSASKPLAVLKLPVVLLDRASLPLGRVNFAGRVAIERKSTVGHVGVTGIVKERLPTGGGVARAGCAATHRCTTGGGVEEAGGVAVERSKTIGRVVIACVIPERQITNPGVAHGAAVVVTGVLTNSDDAEAVAVPKRAYTDGHILGPGGVAKERAFTNGCVSVACAVVKEC